MQDRLRAMQDNDIEGLVDLSDNVKSINCKKVYKTKGDPKVVLTFKVGLVVKVSLSVEGLISTKLFRRSQVRIR